MKAGLQHAPRTAAPPQRKGGECQHKHTVDSQLKLRVHPSGDEFEREADRVAASVLRGRPATIARSAGLKRLRYKENALPELAGAPPIVEEVLRTHGQPLDSQTRGVMETWFGHDFSRVRVHRNGRAAESARAMQAEAYTAGRSVVFGEGHAAPGTVSGLQLLAHELTHVIQQQGVADSAPVVQRSVGGGIAGGLIGGLGGGLLGLALGGPIGGLIGLVVGAVVGAIIGHLATRERRLVHWETLGTATQLLRDPGAAAPETVATLPAGTRLRIVDTGEGRPFNRQGGNWVYVRVTTGPHLNGQGWLRRTEIVERPETTEVSPESAAELFTELAAERFLAEGGGEAPIPYHYPVDGCYARARRMSDILTEKGYASERVFAVSRVPRQSGVGTQPGLRVQTPFAGDAPAGAQPEVRWWYHTAPIIRVRDPQRGVMQMVLDPSTQSGPVTIEAWTRTQRNEAFAQMSLEDVQSLVNQRGGYPAGNIVFTAPREQFYPPIPNQNDPDEEQEQAIARERLTAYATLATTHELAAEIRRLLSVSPVNADAIIDAIRRSTATARQGLWSGFPNLRAQILAAVSPADAGRIQAAIATP